MKILAQIPSTNSRLTGEFANPDNLLGNLVSKLLVYAVAAAGIYFFVKTVSAGFAYLSSFGDPAKVQTAQKTLINSLTGLIIVISSFFMGQIIQSVFGVNIGL